MLPSSSALKGSGTVPDPGSMTTCAAGAVFVTEAMVNIVIVAMSVFGNAADMVANAFSFGG